jgi:hypothetical protein
MTVKLSPGMRDAIYRFLDDVENHHGILDVYRAAQSIRLTHPDEEFALDDIVAALMTGRGGIRAIEFDPQTAWPAGLFTNRNGRASPVERPPT